MYPESHLVLADPAFCDSRRALPGAMLHDIYIGDRLPENQWLSADAAIIASPTALHTRHMRLCADRGIPFLVEKPACLASEAAALAELIRSEPRAAVGFCYRFHPSVPAEFGANFGRISFFARDNLLGRYGLTCPETMGSHSLDLACYLLGPIRRAELTSAGGRTLWGETRHARVTAYYNLRMDEGPRASYFTLEDPFLGDKVRLRLFHDDEMYSRELKAFLDYALGGERDPRLATLADGLEVARALAKVEPVHV